jgi:hypothetical protein
MPLPLQRKIHPQVTPSPMQGLRTRVQLKALVPKVLVPKVKPLQQQSKPLLLALLIRGAFQPFLQRLRQQLRLAARHLNRN